jgi:glycopeptide antibiotics resistance protein
MIENFLIFIPFGLFLGPNFKKIVWWQKLIFIFVFSLAIETIQYILAIGVSDITDIITNFLGGLFGLAIYSTLKRYIDTEKIDRFVAILIAFLSIVFLVLRFFVFRVKY